MLCINVFLYLLLLWRCPNAGSKDFYPTGPFVHMCPTDMYIRIVRFIYDARLCSFMGRERKTTLRICTFCSGPSLFVDIFCSIHRFCKRAKKALIRLRKYAVWSGPSLPAGGVKVLFLRLASYVSLEKSTTKPRHKNLPDLRMSIQSFPIQCQERQVFPWCRSITAYVSNDV